MGLLHKYRSDLTQFLLLFGAFLLARILFLRLMPNTVSSDVYTWLDVMDVMRKGQNPYRETTVINWAPFWLQILFVVLHLSSFLHMGEVRLIQMVLIAAEGTVLLLAYIILRHYFQPSKPFTLLLAGIAFDPICIFQSCQHGNFDVFVALWVLLFCIALLDFHSSHDTGSWLMACFFLGMGVLTKTVPLILSPLLLAGIEKETIFRKMSGLVLLLTPVCLGMSVLVAIEPYGTLRNIFAYRSVAGWFGITGLLKLAGWEHAIELYRTWSPLVFLGVIGYLSVGMSRIDALGKNRLIAWTFLLLFIIPAFGPGYGSQYIYWFLPIGVILFAVADHPLKRTLTLTLVVAVITYTIEYGTFLSHGAFLLKMFPGSHTEQWSAWLSSQRPQVIIRLPLFACYMLLTISTLRFLRQESPAPAFADNPHAR